MGALPFLATIDVVPTDPRSDWPDATPRAVRRNLMPGWRPWPTPRSDDLPHAGIRPTPMWLSDEPKPELTEAGAHMGHRARIVL